MHTEHEDHDMVDEDLGGRDGAPGDEDRDERDREEEERRERTRRFAAEAFGDSPLDVKPMGKTLEAMVADMHAKWKARRDAGCELTVEGARCGATIEDEGGKKIEAAERIHLDVLDWIGDRGDQWWRGLFLCEAHTRDAVSAIERRHRERLRKHLEVMDKKFPWNFQWARPGAADLAQRIQPAAMKSARAAIDDMIKDEPQVAVLTLAGPAGTGKTSLAILMLRYLQKLAMEADFGSKVIRMACGARYVSSWDLSGEGEDKAASEQVYRDVVDKPIVVIDDLGAERHGVETVFKDLASKLISVRFQRGSRPPLPTIVTTGLTAEQAERLYGGGVARRFLTDDGGQVRVVRFAPKMGATRAA